MRKIIFTAVIFTSLMNNIIAQDTEESLRNEVIFGLKAGLNLSNVYDSEDEEFNADAKLGFAVGAFVALPITEFIGVQPEVLFSQKGFHGKGSLLGGNYDFTRTTNYIDIPLFFAYKPAESITILAGPQFSYLLSKKDEFKTASTSILRQEEFVNEDFRKNTMSFVGGFDINIEHLTVGVRLAWDVLNNNGDGSSSTPRYKNVWYQATVGYRF